MQLFTTAAIGLMTLASMVSTGAAYKSICLTQHRANYLVNGYASLLTGPQSPSFNATVDALLSKDFTDTSDSINWLAGIPIGATTFPSKAAFRAGQGSQPPIDFTVIQVLFTCSEVFFRWTAGVGLHNFPVKGLNLFSTSNLNNTEAGFQILNSYTEFNVGAWEVDIGRTCSAQGANQ